MKIIYDVFSSFLLSEIEEGLLKAKRQNRWNASSHRWASNIQFNTVGVVSMYNLAQQPVLSDLIKQELKIHFPNCPDSRITLQFYHWHAYSSISDHNDRGKVFGATVYLSKHWKTRWGGLLMWHDMEKPENEWNAFVPQYNAMTINSSEQKYRHLVTPVVPNLEVDRFTLQIFATKRKQST